MLNNIEQKKYKRESLTVALTCLILLLSMAACTQNTQPLDELVSVGNHRLHIYCLGKGNPVVVIDVGFGDSYFNWQSVQEQIAKNTRVCIYERAGYGSSEPGPMPRTSQQIVNELNVLLKNANIPPPFVLVGHSLGGLNTYVYASQHPELVVGLVLLDPPPLPFISGQRFPELYQMAEDETTGLLMAAEEASQTADATEREKAKFYQTLASEHEMLFSESAEQAAAIETLGEMRLIVIASGKPNPAFQDFAEEYQRFWIEQNEAMSRQSTNGAFILAEESSHNLYVDAPKIVIEAVERMIE